MQAVLALRSLCSSSLQLILGARCSKCSSCQVTLNKPAPVCTSASGVTNAECFKDSVGSNSLLLAELSV